MIRIVLTAIAIALASTFAYGQSAPSNPAMTYGMVPTVGQWNNWFQQKQDTLGFTPLNQAGGTMLGRLITTPSTSSMAGFSVLPGIAPNLPNNGDVWLTSTGLYYRAGNITFGPIGAGTITGPSTSAVGNVATWGNAEGTSLLDSGKSLPSGAIVGTTDTQTLTNKSISADQINSGLLPPARLGFNPGPLYATRAALVSSSVLSTAPAVFLQSYSTTSAPYLTKWTRQASCPGSPQAWDAQSADGACWQLDEPIIAVQMLGAAANNSTDDATAFQNAFLYAAAKLAKVYIPRASYTLGAQISTTFPIDIISDASANVRFTNSGACGFLFDLRANSFGLNTVTLPNLYSPAINSSFQIPGYAPGTPVATTGTSGTGTTATVTFSGGATIPIGDRVTIAGITPSGYNGTYFVTASSAGSVSFANTTTGAQTVAGTILDATYSYNLNSRVCDAVHIKAGSRMTYATNYMAGFSTGYNVEATFDGTYGAKAVDNIDLHVNTIDFTTQPFYFNAGPSTTGGIHAVRVSANTIWGKFPFYFDVTTNTVSQLTASVGGQAFINEPGGAGIYANGNNLNTSTLDINWLYAGYGNDSTTGVSSTLTIPFIAGTNSSNGLTTDGNATVGYFGAFRNKLTVGLAVDQAGNPGGNVPASGKVIRVRDSGAWNETFVKYFDQPNISPVALSTTQGEANYGGGVGAASLSKRTYYQAAVPTLAAGATATFYFYNQLLSAGATRPVVVIPINNGIAASGLQVVAADRAAGNAVNREGTVVFTNPTASSITGATYFFFVEINN